jgi:OOP family OmpA-OmpF porin
MNTRQALALSACLSLVSFGVSAQVQVEGDVETSGSGYVNAGGMVLKTGLGQCLQTGALDDDNVINACAGIADEEEVAEVATKVVEAPVVPAPPAQKSTIDTRQFSEQALFDTNSADLNSAGTSAMDSMFSALAEYKGITGITVAGHTDSRGTEEYNQALSEQRAATVAAAIAARYADSRIDVQGMGESSPVASNDTAEGRQLNRRVEVEITATRMTFN